MHEDMIYNRNDNYKYINSGNDQHIQNNNSANYINILNNLNKLIDIRKTIDYNNNHNTNYYKRTNKLDNNLRTDCKANDNDNIGNKITKNINHINTDNNKLKMHNRKQIILMSATILATLSLILDTSRTSRVDAKPLSQYQVRFRRLPPKEFTASMGSSITIECEAGGTPQPMIHWLKNGVRVVQNEQIDEQRVDEAQSYMLSDGNRAGFSTTRSRLFIDCATVFDDATYTCVAENAYSRISSHTKLNMVGKDPLDVSENELNDLVANTLLDKDQTGRQQLTGNINKRDKSNSLTAVSQCLRQGGPSKQQSPARIHMWTHNVLENMKNDIILYCRSNAKRLTTTTLGSNGNKQALIDQQSQQYNNFNAPTINDNINNNNNKDNNNNNNYQLSELNNDSSQNELELDQQQQTGYEGNSVSWISPDEKLITDEQADRYEILPTGDLLIKNLKWSDMGNYVCTVSDGQTSDSISTFVYPAALPKKETSTSQQQQQSTSSSSTSSSSSSSDGGSSGNSRIKRAATITAQDDTNIYHTNIRQI